MPVSVFLQAKMVEEVRSAVILRNNHSRRAVETKKIVQAQQRTQLGVAHRSALRCCRQYIDWQILSNSVTNCPVAVVLPFAESEVGSGRSDGANIPDKEMTCHSWEEGDGSGSRAMGSCMSYRIQESKWKSSVLPSTRSV